MLDKKSRQVLKLAISLYDGNLEKDIPINSQEINIAFAELNSLCQNLYALGYLSTYWRSSSPIEPILIRISHKGLHYFENERKTSFHFWLPILLSNLIAASALLISILAYIKQ